MTEVAGAGAILIDPENPAAAANTIAARFGEADAVRQAGWENLKNFTTDAVMTRYSDAYRSALERASRPGPNL
jgi:hypothetical protein